MKSDKEKIKELADYLKGYADATHNEKLQEASIWLEKLSWHICGQGFIGCPCGEECSSDHK